MNRNDSLSGDVGQLLASIDPSASVTEMELARSRARCRAFANPAAQVLPGLEGTGENAVAGAELASRVQKASPARIRRRTRLWIGAGALAGTGLLGGIGAAAAGLFVIPGTEQVTPLATPVTKTYTGTATVDLGEPPEGTTGIELELICLTAGRYEFQDGASSMCSADDAASPGNWSGYTVNLTPGQHSVTIKTDPASRWQLTAKYVKQVRTTLGVNAKGETYGVDSQQNGTPDLVAVLATNGKAGYVYAKDLYGGSMPTSPEDAAKNFSNPIPLREIPVYLRDGQTKVGVFEAAGGGTPSYPSPAPVQPTADAPATPSK